MNINVTSDRAEWQTGKYQFIMSSGLGQTLYCLCNRPGDDEVIFTKHCNQYTILPQRTLKDDHTEQDVTAEDSE